MIKGLEALERVIETFYDKESEDIKTIEKELKVLEIIKKYMKIKGDMLVMENVSRKKNKKDFEEMEKFLNEYQR